jgi:hypothetical protein
LNLLPEAKQLLAAVEIGEHPEHGTSEPILYQGIDFTLQRVDNGGKITLW